MRALNGCTAMSAPESDDKLTRFVPVQLAMPRRKRQDPPRLMERGALGLHRVVAPSGGSQQGANTSRSRQQTNWAKGSMEWQDKQERKREAELLAAAADKS